MNLIAYKYEKNSRAFCGVEEVVPTISHDRIVYELPAWSTLVEPPFTERGFVAMWQPHAGIGQGHWLVMEDHRGEPGWINWKGEAIVILSLGNPADKGLQRAEAVKMKALQGDK